MFYEFISEIIIKPAPRPLRIDNNDIFTTDERIYNENGYYKLIREDYPENTEYLYSAYYELVNNTIYQKWKHIKKIGGGEEE